MKHSDTYSKFRQLHEQELKELALAVKAHGGEYKFFDCDVDDPDEDWGDMENHDSIPTVVGEYGIADAMYRCYVTKVMVNKYGMPIIFGFESEYGWPSQESALTDIAFGHVGFITDEIPDTEEVQSVSAQQS